MYKWNVNILLNSDREITEVITNENDTVEGMFDYIKSLLTSRDFVKFIFPDSNEIIGIRSSDVSAFYIKPAEEESE